MWSSGIAPICAAIESGDLKTSSGGRTARLYYGVKNEKDLCFVDRFSTWEKNGVQVVPVLSQPSDSWQGRTGYVQNALEEDGTLWKKWRAFSRLPIYVTYHNIADWIGYFLTNNEHFLKFIASVNSYKFILPFFCSGVPVPRNTGALLCGMKGMVESVTEILTKAGTFEGRILANF